MPMKPEIKELWVEALRSGEYEQGRGRLTQWNQDGDEMFCCLGVLCDIAIKNGVEVPVTDWCYEDSDWASGIPEDIAGSYIYADEVEFLPEPVMEWAGLADAQGTYIRIESGETQTLKLTTLNDEIGLSFADIADEIEKFL